MPADSAFDPAARPDDFDAYWSDLLEELEIFVNTHGQYDRVVELHRRLYLAMRFDVFDDAGIEPVVGEILANPSRKIVIRADD